MTAIDYHPEALEELRRAAAYYRDKAVGVARQFVGEVFRAEGFVAQFPLGGEEIRPGVRKRPLRTFPYSLLYSPGDDGVLVVAVMHQSRRPEYWTHRAP
ncbi:MAG: type II toxin-antitoxin system RelE/ParE family toxin [Acidobacteriota bacterium]